MGLRDCPKGAVEKFKYLAFFFSLTCEGLRSTGRKSWSVQKDASSPALSHAEGKAAVTWTGGAYGGVRGHGQVARTPLATFFNISIRDDTSWIIRNSDWRHFGRQSGSVGNPFHTTGRQVGNAWFLKPFKSCCPHYFNIYNRPLLIHHFAID